ncbi:tRNA-intron endonuclease catalytic domain-like protein, partial [Neocallimastix californiae]
LEEARTKQLWNYPSNPKEEKKYKVFCDIWEKPENYYITSGSKYGSDYLIYPGDPIQYHSNFIATVIYDSNFNFSPKYIIKYGRLGTNVKKTHLLCNINETTNQINYYSIEWSSWI